MYVCVLYDTKNDLMNFGSFQLRLFLDVKMRRKMTESNGGGRLVKKISLGFINFSFFVSPFLTETHYA